MAILQFDEVIDLINQSRVTAVNKKPRISGNGWSLFDGAYRIHGNEFPFEVLYLDSKAVADNFQEAKRKAFKKGYTDVVYAPSLDSAKRSRAHHDLFKSDAKRFLNLKEYLRSFIRDELDRYKERLGSLKPTNFVEPPIQVPAGTVTRAATPAFFRFFEDPRDEEDAHGILGALLADPGHGKTYASEHIVSKLAERQGVLPIYINAKQWHSMAMEDLGSLWKTISFSFRYFESPISWIEGCEHQFLETTLKAGLFAIIFDGFDEYVLRNQGRVTARDALHALQGLVDSTGCRVLVTSRSSFWNSELEAIEQNEDILQRTLVYRLKPFTLQHADEYFSIKLGDNKGEIGRAKALFNDLRRHGDEFVGKGFILSLIAQLVKDDGNTANAGESAAHPAKWLMFALCAREQERQELPLNAAQQMMALELIVSQTVQGAPFADDTVDLSLSIANPQLDQDTRKKCIGKLRFHPLINCHDGWSFPQEQVRILLLAIHVLTAIDEGGDVDLIDLAEKGDLSNAEIGDLSSSMIELLTANGHSEQQAIVSRVARKLLSVTAPSGSRYDSRSLIRRLATSVGLSAVEKLLPTGSSHSDRTRLLQEIFGTLNFEHLSFYGALARFDFRGSVFDHCYFDRVHWANCEFDQDTIFKSSHFVGGRQDFCKGFADAKWPDLIADEDGSAFINSQLVSSGKRKYSEDDLRSDIRLVINKFLAQGGVALKTVREEYLDSGPISSSRNKKDVIEELGRRVIERHSVSGISEAAFHVREGARESVRFFATNNVFIGPLQEVFEKLAKKLVHEQ